MSGKSGSQADLISQNFTSLDRMASRTGRHFVLVRFGWRRIYGRFFLVCHPCEGRGPGSVFSGAPPSGWDQSRAGSHLEGGAPRMRNVHRGIRNTVIARRPSRRSGVRPSRSRLCEHKTKPRLPRRFLFAAAQPLAPRNDRDEVFRQNCGVIHFRPPSTSRNHSLTLPEISSSRGVHHAGQA
jgi:hypothetical protein